MKFNNPALILENLLNEQLEASASCNFLIANFYEGQLVDFFVYEAAQFQMLYCPALANNKLQAAATFINLIKRFSDSEQGELYCSSFLRAQSVYQLKLCQKGDCCEAERAFFVIPKIQGAATASPVYLKDFAKSHIAQITAEVHLLAQFSAVDSLANKLQLFIAGLSIVGECQSELLFDLVDRPEMTEEKFSLKILLGQIELTLEEILELRPGAEIEIAFQESAIYSAISLGSTDLFRGSLSIQNDKAVFMIKSLIDTKN